MSNKIETTNILHKKIKYQTGKITQKYIIEILKFIIIGGLFILYIIPFFLVISSSFKTWAEIVSNPFGLPSKLIFSNFTESFSRMNFLISFLNSVIITTISVILIVVISSMAAYLFVRRKWKFNNIMFLLLVSSMFIPFQVVMIPLVKVYSSIHFFNNWWSLVYMYLGFGASMAVFIYHGFIKSIPQDLEEAAMLDGCTGFQTFFLIIFPLLQSTTITIIILDVLWIWNDYLLPSLVLLSANARTLPLSNYSFYGSYSQKYELICASIVMTTIPIVILYLFLQKYIIKGITQGSFR